MLIVEDWTKTRTSSSVITAMNELKIPGTTYANLAEIVDDPQIRSRNLMVQASEQNTTYPVCGHPSKFSQTETSINKSVPAIGQHNTVILETLLGITRNETKD